MARHRTLQIEMVVRADAAPVPDMARRRRCMMESMVPCVPGPRIPASQTMDWIDEASFN
jgi:hypothetical protein